MSSENDSVANGTADRVAPVLQNGLPQADLLRATTFDNFQLVAQARAASLRREQQRLADSRGDDHPRIPEVSAKLAATEGFALSLGVESERARLPVPEVNEETWVVYGFIRDQQLRGVPKVTVALYDANGDWARRLGFSGTEANGSFRLAVRNTTDLKSPLFIHVLSGQATLLHADDEPLTPELGTVLFHEVIISGEKTAAPPVESKDDPVAQPDTWIVRGRITDKKGKGLSQLIVSVWDKDLLFDDKLGQTETDANGDYSLTYHVEDFRDLIERKPDLYVNIFDQKGTRLFSSKKKIRFNAGRVEIINVEIDAQ